MLDVTPPQQCGAYTQCQVQFTKIIEELADISRQQKTIATLLTGNGTPDRGMIVRLDRIEQGMERRGWRDKAVFGAALSALIGVVIKFIRG